MTESDADGSRRKRMSDAVTPKRFPKILKANRPGPSPPSGSAGPPSIADLHKAQKHKTIRLKAAQDARATLQSPGFMAVFFRINEDGSLWPDMGYHAVAVPWDQFPEIANMIKAKLSQELAKRRDVVDDEGKSADDVCAELVEEFNDPDEKPVDPAM
jgi:hypothetical protein